MYLVTGGYTGYALRENGAVIAFGQNHSGTVNNAPTDTGYYLLTSAHQGACAWRNDGGQTTCWGEADAGMRDDPPQNTDLLDNWADNVATGCDGMVVRNSCHSYCALNGATNKITCWGQG